MKIIISVWVCLSLLMSSCSQGEKDDFDIHADAEAFALIEEVTNYFKSSGKRCDSLILLIGQESRSWCIGERRLTTDWSETVGLVTVQLQDTTITYYHTIGGTQLVGHIC